MTFRIKTIIGHTGWAFHLFCIQKVQREKPLRKPFSESHEAQRQSLPPLFQVKGKKPTGPKGTPFFQTKVAGTNRAVNKSKQ